MGGSEAETIRQPRDRLTGQPQEGQHSGHRRRDPGPTAPGEGCRILFVRKGSSPEGPRREAAR
jgi:hypothetical protein